MGYHNNNFFSVKPHNIGGLFAIMTLIGVSSITMLPVSLELACELTRNADGSSAILWFMYVWVFIVLISRLTQRNRGNLFGVIFVLCPLALDLVPATTTDAISFYSPRRSSCRPRRIPAAKHVPCTRLQRCLRHHSCIHDLPHPRRTKTEAIG